MPAPLDHGIDAAGLEAVRDRHVVCLGLGALGERNPNKVTMPVYFRGHGDSAIASDIARGY